MNLRKIRRDCAIDWLTITYEELEAHECAACDQGLARADSGTDSWAKNGAILAPARQRCAKAPARQRCAKAPAPAKRHLLDALPVRIGVFVLIFLSPIVVEALLRAANIISPLW